MEIILAKTCRSLTGCLGKKYGCSITRRGKRFFTIRHPEGTRAKGGFLRFILECARMAEENFLMADIIIRGEELSQAAREAGITMETILPDVQYNAQDIRKIKTYYGL